MCCEEPAVGVVSTRPPEMTKSCKDTNCSQLCVGAGECTCHEGFKLKRDGVTCEDVNECQTGSHNCSSESVCVNTEGSFYCLFSCHPGFTLTDEITCKDIDECEFGIHNCEQNSVCINTAGSFHCQPKNSCGEGYTPDAAGRCIDFDECLITKVCGNHVCVNVVGSYRCECRAGFSFNNVTGHCEDINECRHHARLLCSHACENTEGSYRCSCIPGFTLAHDSRNCDDINECLAGMHNCGDGQVCVNTEGSFHCQRLVRCDPGYQLTDSNSCQDIDECVLGTHNCGANFVCINTPGSFHCNTVSCPPGYHLSADGTRCEDVDECQTSEMCGGHVCINLEGSFRCECRTGFMFNTISKLCEDINECTHYPGRLCAHKCENTEGSFRCSCSNGFKLTRDGRDCEDVDECENKPCSQECTNVYGSYQCYCHRGYQLSDNDGITCEDINECTLPGVCSHNCINTPGGFNCTCPPGGYTLSPDGRTCQDVDECAAETHTCSASEICFNLQGGHRCFNFECPTNFRQATSGSTGNASAVLRCVKSCRLLDLECSHNPTHIITFTIISLPTLQHLKEPEVIALLRTATAVKPANLPDKPDVIFEILDSDEQNSFDVIKDSQDGLIVGLICQVKPILGPKELMLSVVIKYVQSGDVYQQNIMNIHILVL
uniref:Fibulin-1 n=2 Tax=Nothobranchius kuhntae TaxID=321403 RepID=A0A1A8J1P1_NOTKU